jgi:hypothetical protein
MKIDKSFYIEHSAEQSRIVEEATILADKKGISFAQALAVIRVQRDDEKIKLLKMIADRMKS